MIFFSGINIRKFLTDEYISLDFEQTYSNLVLNILLINTYYVLCYCRNVSLFLFLFVSYLGTVTI